MIETMKFGEWLPDQSELGSMGITKALNVIPHANGYQQLGSMATFSNALGARCQGAISVQHTDADVIDFAGDATKLYKLGGATWSNVSGATYTTSATDKWSLLQFGSHVIASNGTDVMQTYQLGVSSTFGVLGGTPPKAKYLASSRNFVFAGYTTVGSTTVPHRIQWSGLNDASDWSASQTTQSDSQELPSENGPITGVVGGDGLTIFQARAITRCTYVGTPNIWSFDEVSSGLGCPVPGSIVHHNENIYFISSEDFYIHSNGQTKPIGAQKVAQTFYADLNIDFLDRVSSSVDPVRHLVVWSYPSVASQDGTPDKMIMYDWVLNRWTEAEVDHDIVYKKIGESLTLDNLDGLSSSIDDLGISLDSRLFKGNGTLLLGTFSTDFKLSFLAGEALDATIETASFQLKQGRRSLVKRARPIVEGGSATVTLQHASKDQLSETEIFGVAKTPSKTGNVGIRNRARYHKLRLNISGGFSHVLGIDVDYSISGTR